MKKHVCMIAYSHYPSDARIRRAAETLAQLPAYRVRVVALKQGATARTYRMGAVTVQELNLGKYRGGSNGRYLLEYLKFLVLATAACTRQLLGGKLDIVHVHNMPNFLLFAAALPLVCGKPLLLDIHDTLPETYASKFALVKPDRKRALLQRLLVIEEALCCRLAHRIICVNHIQKKALTGRGIPDHKISVVLNAPDPRWFNALPERPHLITPGPLRLVYFGTLTRRLGVDLAIHAVSLLGQRLPALELHIIGDGESRSEFLHLSRTLGIAGQVRFYEKIYPVDELAQIVQTMHLVVIPNRRNAATELMLPVKMLEGVALAIPIVAPRLQAIQHYFPDDAVFYYEPDNVEALAEAIATAWENPELRFAKAARARAFLAHYGWDRHRYALINLYNRLCLQEDLSWSE